MSELARSGKAVALDATGTLVGSVVSAILERDLGPQLAGAAGGVAGAFAKEASSFVGRLFADRRRRATSMVEHASEAAGQPDVDEFLTKLLGDEHHRELLYRSIQAAAQSTSEAKIKTLASALASGSMSGDPAVVDESLVVVDTLAQLEAPHIRLLELLTTEPADPAAASYGFRPWPWRQHQLIEADPGLSNAFDALLARLTSLGMVTAFKAGHVDYADDRVHLTRFGQICMGYLAEQAGDAEDLHGQREGSEITDDAR
ncbi:hypothetical protein AB0880_19775 [Micromonospora chersina]|uniref:hypothetical protein n=1 Tax=Micromonospora chersina TaxID=47854 RepID=UPI0034514ED2